MDRDELLRLDRIAGVAPKAITDPKDVELVASLKTDSDAALAGVIRDQIEQTGSPELWSMVRDIDLSGPDGPGAALLAGLEQRKPPPDVIAQAKAQVDRVRSVGQELGHLPIAANPLIRDQVAAARMHRVAELATLDPAKATTLVDGGLRLAGLDDDQLTALVDSGQLAEPEARSVGLATTLYRLVDEDVTFAGAILGQRGEGLPPAGISELRDLVPLDVPGWKRLIEGAGVTPPGGLSAEQYVLLLTKRIEAAYPTASIGARLGESDAASIANAITAAAPALADGSEILSTRSPDLERIDPKVRPNVEKSLGELRAIVGSRAGLGLEAIVADTTAPPDQRAARAVARAALFDRFVAANGDTELVHLDLSPGSGDIEALDFVGASAEERPALLAHTKAMQRSYAVTGDATDAAKLMRARCSSAAAIASATLADFTAATGLTETRAVRYYDDAMTTVGTASAMVTSMLDIVRGGFVDLNIANLDPSIEDFFKQIDGYEDLFGSQDYCACKHCRSILSPAAYFVDLMHFIEQYLLDPVFTGAKTDHVLNLRVRRPDLWTLPLTCENTDHELPQLVIVDEILENYIARRTGFAGDLADRDAVETEVYRQRLASSTACFDLPFVYPFARVAAYLQHFGVPRSDFVRLAGGTGDQWAGAELGLPTIELTLITQANTTQAFLNQVYAQTFDFQPAGVTPFDAQLLLRPMGVNREQLGALVTTAFVSAAGAEPVTIVGGRLSAASVQNDIERITGLRPSSLDRLHRFTRLWRACDGWSIAELDLVVAHLDHAGLSSGLQPATLEAIATLRSLQRRSHLPVEELVSLFDDVPTEPVVTDKAPLFDRLFNLPELVKLDGPLPMAGNRFVHPSLRDDPTVVPSDHMLHRLLAGLRVDATALFQLIQSLEVPLGADLDAATEADRGFLLTRENLTLLARHALLTRLLKLSVPELFRLLALLPGGPISHVAGLGDLGTVFAAWIWISAAKRSLDDLAVVVGAPPANAAAYPDAAATAQKVVDRLAADRSLTFTDTAFTLVPGVTEAGSRAIVTANAAAFTPAGDQLRLSDAFDPTAPLALPAGVTAAEADLREILLTHHSGTLVRAAIASEFKLPADKATSLLTLAGVDLDTAAVVQEANGNGAIATLTAAVAALTPMSVLLGAKDVTAAIVDFVSAHPDLFALTDLTAVSIEAVRKVESFRRHAAKDSHRAAQLMTALTGFTPATWFSNADPAALAEILSLESAVTSSLQANLALPTDGLDALDVLAAAAAVTRTVGIGGEAIKLVAADDYDHLDQAADALFAAFRAKYADEPAWDKAFEPFECRLLGERRDGLANFLVHAIHPEFERIEDLYRYFLLDVEVDGCFKTSRLVAAISSAQLYVHRVLMNLEQDRAGNVHVEPARVPRDEWEWRQHYRVWEANRKVFLWPENYLFPDLRDDKTPPFEDLAKELLQTDVDEQAVLDAYGTYLDAFQELAGLTIAGAYQEVDHAKDADVLHLFGVTPGDPATFYYRRVENIAPNGRRAGGTVWGPWRRVEVAIPVRDVAPIVYNGRLHLLWVEIITSPVNDVADGGSRFVGYSHKMTVKFTTLRLDGRWTAPQKVSLYGTDPFGESDGIVEDPLAEPDEWADFSNAVGGMVGWGIFGDASQADNLDDAMQRLLTPRYDTEVHVKARDGYTLRGLEWTQLYPEVHADGLFVAGVDYQLRAYVDTFDKATSTAASLHFSRQASALIFNPPSPLLTKRNGVLYYGTPSIGLFDDYALAALVTDRSRLDRVLSDWAPSLVNVVTQSLYVGTLANIGGARLSPINGCLSDGIVDAGGDLYLLQVTPSDAAAWVLRRLGTTLAEEVARALFTHGVEGLLDLDTQRALQEAPRAFSLSGNRIVDRVNEGILDFTGPFGTYYREIFFHIPFLIANHLNGQGKYAQAERWYHHIFDPTSSEVIPPDPNLSAQANQVRQRDRNWRYLEFRGLTVPTLRQVLTDSSAIAAYHKDPFNPHAIARLRLSANQKAIVMRYIDNKLDLADSLFERFEMETVNEALIHYATVADILGDRPAQLGGCGEGGVDPRTYEKIRPLIDKGSEFLIEAEHLVFAARTPSAKRVVSKFVKSSLDVSGITAVALRSAPLREVGVHAVEDAARVAPEATRALFAARSAPVILPAAADVPTHDEELPARRVRMRDEKRPVGLAGIGHVGADDLDPDSLKAREDERVAVRRAFEETVTSVDALPAVVAVAADRNGHKPSAVPSGEVSAGPDWKRLAAYEGTNRLRPKLIDRPPVYCRHKRVPGRFGYGVIRQISPVFCVPPNKDLLGYWDRLEDRLWKLRNCRDITGALRKLSLFAPEIDPMALVRARAAGLSLEDALNSLNGDVPPYRFAFLLERAKSQATAVQGFGNGLQAALERRDGEHLNVLRAQQQQQILALTTKAREQERDAAANAVTALERHRTTVEHRKAYFDGLVNGSLTPEEQAERISKHVASAMHMTEATLGFLAGALHLIPQLGSPFAMKYGGVETGSSAHKFAVGVRATADFAEALAASAGIEAGFARRDQGWQQQVDATEDELAEIDVQIAGATLRRDVAEQSILVHTRAVEQAEEVLDMYHDHFTNVGLYTFLSTVLQRLHREAFNTALALARMAEQAYRFERGDDAFGLIGTYWDAEHAGLSAGAQLVVDLQRLERRYIETNTRDLEIDQSFSLTQIDPAALVQLKETGECQFALPELFFDLAYPGHYRRRIKSARLTIPCVTGPYANVSATLQLTQSWIRKQPALGAANLVPVPDARATTIATSTAQSDPGVFELNFRDERYMPFEGAGAVSAWRLTLPKTFKQFDYATINDVMIRLAYTATADGAFRDAVEAANAATEGTILNVLSDAPLPRVVSLRNELSNSFNRLLHSPVGTDATFELTAAHLPFFLTGRDLSVSSAKLALRFKDPDGTGPGTAAFSLNGTATAAFAPDPTVGNLLATDMTAAVPAGFVGSYALRVTNAGNLAPEVAVPGDQSAIDNSKLLDVYLVLEITAA